LQNTDAHDKGSEYIERLREEVPLYVALVKAQVLFEREGLSDQVARAVMRRLEHIYAKVGIQSPSLLRNAVRKLIFPSLIPLSITSSRL